MSYGICGRWAWDQNTRKSTYTENKEPHYNVQWKQSSSGDSNADYDLVRCVHVPRSKPWSNDRGFTTQYGKLPPSMKLNLKLTPQNSTQHARRVQAHLFKTHGYEGPVQAGEVIALKNLMAKLGKQDHIVYGWRLITTKDAYFREVTRMKGPNYLFKSPIKGLDFKDFIMLARMYRDGKGLKDAVNALLKRVPSELKHEAETFRTIDVLAGLGEGKVA